MGKLLSGKYTPVKYEKKVLGTGTTSSDCDCDNTHISESMSWYYFYKRY